MHDFFLDFVRENALFAEGEKVLLTISGGLDSVVMAHLFSQSPYAFGIAHVNFELRGEESEEDSRFVEALAAQLQVPFYTTRLRAAAHAEEEKVSIQMAARDLRYHWFEELRRQHGYHYIATAHHLNDLTETMLLNLSRGTGLAGLHGIAPRRDRVVRPMLFASRQQIEAYAQEEQLSWREDSSNSSLKYRRNKIRKQVVPVLQELNPRVAWAFLEAARQVRAAENLLQEMVNRVRQEILHEHEGHFYLQLPYLLQQQEPQYLLAALLEPFGMGWQEAGAILRSLQNSAGTASGRWFSSPTHRITIDRQQLVISDTSLATPKALHLSCTEGQTAFGPYMLQTRLLAARDYQISAEASVAALDVNKLEFPLQVRTPLPGDWFMPLGMKGKKKLSDFMIDRKIPVNLKAELPLLLSGDAIAWVAGYRLDERFKLSPQTEQVFEIRLFKP